jgi:hypothetical protein
LSEFEIFQTMLEDQLLNQPKADLSPWGLSLAMFQHAHDNLQLYKALAGKQGGSPSLGYLHRYLSVVLRAHLNQQFPMKENAAIPSEILAHHLISTFMALLTWWIDNNMPYSIERMNDMFRRLTQPVIETMM